MRKLFALILFCSLAAGCNFGMTAKKYPPAQQPNGVVMQVTTAKGQWSGELIEVRETGIVLLAGGKLRLLPYTEIVSSNVEKTDPSHAISKGAIPNNQVREHLRLLSRFPQGLSPELLQQLLSAYNQVDLTPSP